MNLKALRWIIGAGIGILCSSWLYAAPPSILSPTFSTVSYLSGQAPSQWKLIISGDTIITKLWIDGEEREVASQNKKTLILDESIVLLEGKNTIHVEAKNDLGEQSKRTFTIYYYQSKKKLKAVQKANQEAGKGTHSFFASVGVGQRSDSNAARLSDATIDDGLSSDDTKASVSSTELALGYQLGLEGKGSHLSSYQLQYLYFQDNYEDKNAGGIDFEELGLRAHTFVNGLTWQSKASAWHFSYTLSRFEGSRDEDKEEGTSSAANVATFHYLTLQYIRAHGKSWSSRVGLQGTSKDFEEEADIAEDDRDTAFSPHLIYDLFYYLPASLGRLQLTLGGGREAAQGKAQRYSDTFFGIRHEKIWKITSITSELKLNIGTLSQEINYEENRLENNSDRHTKKSTTDISASYIYDSFLTAALSHSRIDSDSNVDDFTYETQVTSFKFGAQWRF